MGPQTEGDPLGTLALLDLKDTKVKKIQFCERKPLLFHTSTLGCFVFNLSVFINPY